MADFVVMITTDTETFLIDSVDNFQIRATSEMTSHPMVNGDVIGDHLITHPTIISMSGSFSMKGSTNNASLGTVQKQFEALKKDGAICTVAKINANNKEFRFLKRINMVLTAIVWTEYINSLDFDFTFTQVLYGEIIEKTVSSTIKNLPDIMEPVTLKCEGTLVSENDLYGMILTALEKSGIVDRQFLEQVVGTATTASYVIGGIIVVYLGSAAWAGITAGVTAMLGGAGAAASWSAAVGAATAVPGVGWIIAVGAVIVIGIGYLIYEAVQANKLKYKAFKSNYSDYEEQRNENDRFVKMMDAIYRQVSQINTWMKVYTFTQNSSQETLLNIGGQYYVFTFNKNNVTVSPSYRVRISDFNGRAIKTGVVTGIEASSCNASNAFTSIPGGDGQSYKIYFLGDSSNLTKMQILISSIDPSDLSNKLIKLIESAINN